MNNHNGYDLSARRESSRHDGRRLTQVRIGLMKREQTAGEKRHRVVFGRESPQENARERMVRVELIRVLGLHVVDDDCFDRAQIDFVLAVLEQQFVY